jgi:hypothetical protein
MLTGIRKVKEQKSQSKNQTILDFQTIMAELLKKRSKNHESMKIMNANHSPSLAADLRFL